MDCPIKKQCGSCQYIGMDCMAIQSVHAQDTPKWADKAKKAVFSIVTYDKENKIKNRCKTNSSFAIS